MNKNGAFQDSKQSWVDPIGKLSLKQTRYASLIFQAVASLSALGEDRN